MKVLGVLAMIDDGELDWKVIVVNSEDALAPKLNDIPDVEKHCPGVVTGTVKAVLFFRLARCSIVHWCTTIYVCTALLSPPSLFGKNISGLHVYIIYFTVYSQVFESGFAGTRRLTRSPSTHLVTTKRPCRASLRSR